MTIAPVLAANTGSPDYHAVDFRRMMRKLCDAAGGANGSGVISGDCAVTERGAGANLSVDVAAGGVFVAASTAANGSYFAFWDSAINIPLTTADATNPRIDLIVAQVHDDNVDSGGQFLGQPEKVTGTPAGSPSAPSTPANSVVLARVAVAANATSVHNANITDLRPQLPKSLAIQTSLSVGTTATIGGQASAASVRTTTTGAVGLATDVHALQAGPTGGANVAHSGQAIQARSAGSAADLNLNPLGGNVTVGPGGLASDLGDVQAGAAQLGSISGIAYYSTRARWSTADYGLAVSDSGHTYLNCSNPGTIYLKFGGAVTPLMSITDSGGTAQWKIPDDLPTLTGTALVISSGLQIGRSSSSSRYKTDITPLAGEIDSGAVIDALAPSVFRYLDPAPEQELSEADAAQLVARRPGFIAEDVAAVVANAAHYDAFGQPDAVDAPALLAIVWDEVRALRARVAELESP